LPVARMAYRTQVLKRPQARPRASDTQLIAAGGPHDKPGRGAA
jgi:hypothetical protein